MNKIILKSKEFLGTEWKHQGRSKKYGVDCAGLIVEVFKELKINTDWDYKGYGRHPDGGHLMKVILNVSNRVNFEDKKNGDILLFRIQSNPQHLAFYFSENDQDFFIHSQNDVKGGVIETRLDEEWKNKLVGVFRLKDEFLPDE